MNLKKRFLFFCTSTIFIFVVYLKIRKSGLSRVEGWDRKESRNIKDYVSETLLPHIIPEDFCAHKEILLVMIQSKPGNFEARSAVRGTWAQKRNNVSFYFLLGETNNNNCYLQSEIELESLNFGDIIQERFVDHYNNLTLKSVNMLKLFNIYCANSYKYIMKIDDDVFLNINLLTHMLSKRPSTKNLLTGKLMNNTDPFRDGGSKWFVPYELYKEEKYPDYLCGSSYLMSSDVAQKLYRCALQTPIFYIEDVYLTGICAKKMNLTPEHHPQITCNYMKGGFCDHRHLYTIHSYTPNMMRSSFHILKNNECASQIRWRDWIFFFNFI